MKIIQSSLFRAVCALVVGALLIARPDSTLTWITVAIGIVFLLSGVFSCLAYFAARRRSSDYTITDSEGRVLTGYRPVFPIVGIGSILLGALLVMLPREFVVALMYILGALLVLGALNQLVVLFSVRRWCRLSWLFWVCPSLILLTGLYVLFRPMPSARLPLLIIGWCSLLYGATEIINTLKIHFRRKAFEQQQTPALSDDIEEIS